MKSDYGGPALWSMNFVFIEDIESRDCFNKDDNIIKLYHHIYIYIRNMINYTNSKYVLEKNKIKNEYLDIINLNSIFHANILYNPTWYNSRPI